MKSVGVVDKLAGRYPLLGPIVWILSIQYYIVQLIVAQDWPKPYSLAHNTISDLGVTSCGSYSRMLVCSPLHVLMNASFILLGLFMIVGSMLIYYQRKKNMGSAVGFSCMAIAGIGTIMVGLYPENTMSGLHIVGAALPFLIGNFGLVILGRALDIPKSLRYFTIFSGVLTLAALALFMTQTYLGIGIGGMERVVAYPQSIWLIVFGGYMVYEHRHRHTN